MKTTSLSDVDEKTESNNKLCVVCGAEIIRVHATYLCTNCGFSADYSDF